MADNAMHMSMQMTFEASTAVTLWLKQWHTHSRGTYFVSCVGLVALCLLHEALSAFRTRFHEDFVGNQKGSQYETFAPQTPSDREAQSPITKRSMNPTAAKALHSLLYALNLSFSYLLMLAVMTYNVGYFFVIVLGLALGNFIFGGRKSSDICHSQA